jgi:hypothetical protein
MRHPGRALIQVTVYHIIYPSIGEVDCECNAMHADVDWPQVITIQAQICELGVHNALASELRGILRHFHAQVVMHSTVLFIHGQCTP